MKFLVIDDAREMIPIGGRLMKLFGLGRDKKFKLIFWTQCVLYVVACFIPRLLLDIDDVTMLMRIMAELAFGLYLLSQMVALFFRRTQLYDLIDTLQQCANKQYSETVDAFMIRSNNRINQLSINCCKYFIFAYVMYCSTPNIASGIIYIRNRRNLTGEQEEFVIPTEMNFYYLDIRYNLLHYSIYIMAILLMAITSCLSLCTKDVIDVSAIKCTALMFEVAALQIRELRGRISQTQLNGIIRSHEDALRCAGKLKEALNLSLLLQIISCGAMLCLILFYILLMGMQSKILNIFILLVVIMAETYAYCSLGTQLTGKCDDVLMALQELVWYEESVPIQKQILFMIRRSQKPIVLTAGKLFHTNVALFSEMVQKSYSFYLVLQKVF